MQNILNNNQSMCVQAFYNFNIFYQRMNIMVAIRVQWKGLWELFTYSYQS